MLERCAVPGSSMSIFIELQLQTLMMLNWMGVHWGTLPDWKLDDAIDHNMIFPAEAVLICRAVVARWTIFVVISSVSIIAADWGSLASAGKHDSGLRCR